MAPPPLALPRRSCHVASETPVAPTRCPSAYVAMEAQGPLARFAWKPKAPVKLACYLCSKDISFGRRPGAALAGRSSEAVAWKRKWGWRFRVFKYTSSFTIFFSCFHLQQLPSFLLSYTINSVITVLYFNGRVYEDNDGVIFEGSKKAIQIKRGISFNALKKKIGDKVKLQNNKIISTINCRFLVSGKYIALQICDDEDVETMLESFKQQDQMSVLELYIEKDVAGGSMFHSANSLTSCGNYLSNDETQPATNLSNLHIDEDNDDDVSNSYVEESLDEDDSLDGISDTDDEVTDIPQPVKIVHPAEGAQRIENPFWNDALHYNNINWSYPDEEDICGLEMSSTFNVG
ncbi:hypothetical protein HKD37_17G047807 [Glycine soja]